ncbi:Uncharacterised protein [Shigella sonnei]|nr:Uncharacterised protein [Shigella sonnei]
MLLNDCPCSTTCSTAWAAMLRKLRCFFISIKMPGKTGLRRVDYQARRLPGTNHSRREFRRSCALIAFLPAGCNESRFRMPSPVAT